MSSKSPFEDKSWVAEFARKVRKGMFVSTVSGLMRVPYPTVNNWLMNGVDDNHPAHYFYLAIKQADAECEQELVDHWYALALKCGVREVKAVQLFLQARYKSNWGETKEVHVTGEVNHLAKP